MSITRGRIKKNRLTFCTPTFLLYRFCTPSRFNKIYINKKPRYIKGLNGSAGKIRTYDRSVNSRLMPCSVTLANPQKSRYAWVYFYHKMSIFVNNSQHLCTDFVHLKTDCP